METPARKRAFLVLQQEQQGEQIEREALRLDAAAGDEVGGEAHGLAVEQALQLLRSGHVAGAPFGDQFAVVEVSRAAVGAVQRDQGLVVRQIDILRGILAGNGENEGRGAADGE